MNVVTSISASSGAARFTTAEFLRMVASGVFDDMKIELIEGELQRMPPPGNIHARLQASLVIKLGQVAALPLIRAETGIDLGNDTVVGCDAALLRTDVELDGMTPAVHVLLAVEVAVSTRFRDLEMKRQLYAAANIPTYWVVDAERQVIHVFDRPERDDYLGLSLVRFGEALPVPGTDATIVLE